MDVPTASDNASSRLVSNASILIFSGFLLGLVLGRSLSEDLSPYVLATGLSGCLAYLSLELQSRRRKEEARVAWEQELNNRIRKHTTLQLSPPLSLSIEGDPLAEFLHEKGLAPRARSSEGYSSRTEGLSGLKNP